MALVSLQSILPFWLLVVAFGGFSSQNPVGQNICYVNTAIKNAPPTQNVRCGYEGSVKPAAHSTSSGLSFAQCRDTCLLSGRSKSPCLVFSYEESTKTCAQYPERLYYQPKSKTGVKFWNRRCYDVEYYNNTALPNPGFETGNLDGWQYEEFGQSVGNITVVSPGFNSKYAAQLINYKVRHYNPHLGDGPAILQFNTLLFPLCRNVHYRVTMSYFQVPNKTYGNLGHGLSTTMVASVEDAESGDNLSNLPNVDFTKDGSTSSGFSGVSPAGTWTTLTSDFVAPYTRRAGFVLDLTNGKHTGIVLNLDDIQISVVNQA